MVKYLIHGLLLTMFFLVHPLGWFYPILLVAVMGGTLMLPVLVVFLLLFIGVIKQHVNLRLLVPHRILRLENPYSRRCLAVDVTSAIRYLLVFG